jgi:hypothetical protein
MEICVFLGPTLPVAEAQAILPARYLPPVARGDVYGVTMRYNPDVIAIVDGMFTQKPSVWHKEILFALSKGVHVFGSSSMGALRAAELCHFGMEGVGRIFKAYQHGVYEDDDEVTVAHLSEADGFRATSDAMVNLREGLHWACAAGVISPETQRHLTQLAKNLFYTRRSWAALYHLGRQGGIPPVELAKLAEFVDRERPDLKREDAIELLCHLEQASRKELPRRVPDFCFERTFHWCEVIENSIDTPDPLAPITPLWMSGQYEAALTKLDRTLALYIPVPTVLLRERGLILSGLGRYAEAVEAFERALMETPADNVYLHYHLAVTVASWQGLEAGRSKISETRQKVTSSPSPDATDQLYLEAGLCAVEGNHDEALSGLKEAIRLNPKKGLGAWARHDVAWKGLQSLPRFQALVYPLPFGFRRT